MTSLVYMTSRTILASMILRRSPWPPFKASHFKVGLSALFNHEKYQRWNIFGSSGFLSCLLFKVLQEHRGTFPIYRRAVGMGRMFHLTTIIMPVLNVTCKYQIAVYKVPLYSLRALFQVIFSVLDLQVWLYMIGW